MRCSDSRKRDLKIKRETEKRAVSGKLWLGSGRRTDTREKYAKWCASFTDTFLIILMSLLRPLKNRPRDFLGSKRSDDFSQNINQNKTLVCYLNKYQ
jgi:hypothetical protein